MINPQAIWVIDNTQASFQLCIERMSEMKTLKKFHLTNELVPKTGTYICEKGEPKDFREGELFSNCPVNDDHTSWRPANHEHKTGETVTEAGMYGDPHGELMDLRQGELFPICPKTGRNTTWKHVHVSN
jgi:hypothetical protein